MHLAPLLIAVAQASGPGGTTSGNLAWAAGLEASAPFPWGAWLVLAGPASIAVTLVWFYARTARRMRQAQLAPPVWLLPYLEQHSKGPQLWPSTEISAEVTADLADRTESVTRLGRRKRTILLGLALNFVAGWAMAGAYLYESKRGVEFTELPGTPFVGASVDTLGYAGLEDREIAPGPAALPEAPPPPPEDTAAVRQRAEQRQVALHRRDSLLAVRRADSLARAVEEAQRLRDSIAQAVRDSVLRANQTAAPPPPPTPAPPPPPPDPRAELAGATEAIRAGAEALVGAIAGNGTLAGMLAPGGARDGFLRFVQQNSPSASLVSVPDPALAGDRATVTVTIQFQWRGTFGDPRRKTARFQAGAQREGSGWRAAPFTLLDNLP